MSKRTLFNLSDCFPSFAGVIHHGCLCCLLCQLCAALAFAGSERSLVGSSSTCLALSCGVSRLCASFLVGTTVFLPKRPKGRFTVDKPVGDCGLHFRCCLFSSFADCVRDIIQSSSAALCKRFCEFKKPLSKVGGFERISGWLGQPPIDAGWGFKLLFQFLPFNFGCSLNLTLQLAVQ